MRDPTMAAATLVGAQADAMKTAAGNSAGAMTGFMGMGMAMNAGGGGMNAQNLFAMGQQQQQQAQQAQQAQAAAPAAERLDSAPAALPRPESSAPSAARRDPNRCRQAGSWTCASAALPGHRKVLP